VEKSTVSQQPDTELASRAQPTKKKDLPRGERACHYAAVSMRLDSLLAGLLEFARKRFTQD
jgi:hypothetical protein